MVELEYQNERYMVENGQWFRRLKVGEVKPENYQCWYESSRSWGGAFKAGDVAEYSHCYRVPCPDPRPPFVVGQRVRVARKDESWNGWYSDLRTVVGLTGSVVEIAKDGRLCISSVDFWKVWLPPWCLDSVEPSPERAVEPHDVEDVLTDEEQKELSEIQQRLTPEHLNALVEHSQALFKTADPDTSDGIKPCMFCDRQLECACDDWSTKQPHAGGEVQFIFAYGSTKFDMGIGNTVFSAYVCDECAQSYVKKMRQETNITEPT